MLMIVEHHALKVRCAFNVERMLESSGMSPEDVKRCFPTVPKELLEEVSRTATAIKAFIEKWGSAPKDAKPTLPVWVVYIHAIDAART